MTQRMAWADRVLHEVYLNGYRGAVLPRWLRRAAAGTGFHRAWLSGHMGIYSEGDRHRGVTNRDGYRDRKAGSNYFIFKRGVGSHGA